MKDKLNYFEIIHEIIPPDSAAYPIYITHVTLVTAKALKIAQKLKISVEKQQFIEEAAMLHDIGIMKTNAPDIGCFGELDYICHVKEGEKILLERNLPKHAEIALNHVGIGGLTVEEIRENNFPLPAEDIICETIEAKIISYADMFYSKNPKNYWIEKPIEKVLRKAKKYGTRQAKLFEEWREMFE